MRVILPCAGLAYALLFFACWNESRLPPISVATVMEHAPPQPEATVIPLANAQLAATAGSNQPERRPEDPTTGQQTGSQADAARPKLVQTAPLSWRPQSQRQPTFHHPQPGSRTPAHHRSTNARPSPGLKPDRAPADPRRTIPFETRALSQKGAAMVDTAVRRLQQANRRFDLDPQQQDRLFELLVREGNRTRVPLAIDGEPFPAANQMIVDAARSSDDLVRAVLRTDQREAAEAAWNERDAWWDETVSRIIEGRRILAADDEPEGGIGGTGRSDAPEGGIGGTGRIESVRVRAVSESVEQLPTFLAIYDGDGDRRLSSEEITWMAEQPHGLPEDAVRGFDADADGALSADEAATLHAAHHDHVRLVRETHFSGADRDGDKLLAFAEFIDLPAVTAQYRQDPLGTVDAFIALHHEQEAVTIDTFVAAIDVSNTTPEKDRGGAN